MNKESSISYYRVIATIFILICHIGTQYNSGIIAEGFLVGVQMFLLLSGYLSAKGIDKKRGFGYIGKRFLRILIPVWIFTVPYMIVAVIMNMYGVLDFVPYLLGIFGIPRLVNAPEFAVVQGLSHLWYVSIALICELIAPLLLAIKKKVKKRGAAYYATFLASVLLLHLLSLLTQIRFDYIAVFATGVFLSDFLKAKENSKRIIFANLSLIFALALRVVVQMKFDNSAMYEGFVRPFVYLVLAVALFIDIKAVVTFAKRKMPEKLVDNKVVSFFERFSYEIYIAHYIFIVGPLNVYLLGIPEIAKNVLFLVFSLALAVALGLAVRLTNRWCKK